MKTTLPLALAMLMLTGCGTDEAAPPPIGGPGPTPTPTPAPTPVTGKLDFDFANGEDGFTPVFSEYDIGADLSIYEFEADIETVPGRGETGYRMYSINRSDDVFMFLWKPVTGLTPNQQYRIEAVVRFAASVPPNCFGIGGSPSAVVIQAGASPVEPELAPGTEPGSEGVMVPNFEHGVQNTVDGSPFTLGVIAQDIPGAACGGVNNPFRIKELSTDPDNAPVVSSDDQGRLWAFMGTDSPWEGDTEIYWLSGSFDFIPVD